MTKHWAQWLVGCVQGRSGAAGRPATTSRGPWDLRARVGSAINLVNSVNPVISWDVRARVGIASGLCLLLTACHLDMWNQPRYEPLERSKFFADGLSARPMVVGTVPYKAARLDEHLYRGLVNGQPAETYPFPVTRDVIDRGRNRFEVYCTPCHGYTGHGDGMIVQRETWGKQPPSYHDPRLRGVPPGYIFDVITNGYGVMYSYANRVTPEDRWAIVAYLRVLQSSQYMPYDTLTNEERVQFNAAITTTNEPSETHDALH